MLCYITPSGFYITNSGSSNSQFFSELFLC
uniref:Uncharacterized protein n=1 Tax=Myoviridae sp. ctAys2 TaxID=2825044 RepID=A0A8S5Q521_9CAUD|nr:MAG TPA: hypothetical protein [Myoviridae sp. ctAys2]